jgi:hypothetical protein
LLHLEPEVVSKLLALVGDRVAGDVTGATPEEITALVHAARRQLKQAQVGRAVEKRGRAHPARPTPVERARTRLTASELLERMRKASPGLLEEIPEKAAAILVKHAFRRINAALAAANTGMMKCAGLGAFHVRRVNANAGAGKAAHTQIVFRRALGEQGK